MKNFWYVSRSNEIFLDIDNTHKILRHSSSRLLGAVECGRLQVADVEYHQSRSENHLHVIITLAHDLPDIERAIWALVLRSDIYRAASTMMRVARNIPAPDILITPIEFRRPSDELCICESKHNAETMETCPAAIQLRGENRVTGFFGIPSKQEISFYKPDDF